jgi:biotin carboxyl carrier protein
MAMKLDIRMAAGQTGTAHDAVLNAQTESVEVSRQGSRLQVALDGRVIEGDAVEVATGTYTVLVEGRAFEVRVEPATNGLRVHAGTLEYVVQIHDPRAWKRRRSGGLEAEGRQEIAAPMPGKVVRVLVEQGARVEAGQGLFVVEAMKMQNEIRSPKKGTVERLLVNEGQTVNAGEPLAVVV